MESHRIEETVLVNAERREKAGRSNGPALATLDNIQGLRAAAALLVVFVHLDILLGTLGFEPFGFGAVDLFFTISGFIMVYTTQGKSVTPSAFFLNRLCRIAPLYWLITLGVYFVAVVAPSLLQATSTDPLQLVKSLLFVPFEKANGSVHPVLFVGWTLNYEMFFYALFAAGLVLGVRERGVFAVTLVLAGLVLGGLWWPSESALGRFYTRPIILEFAAGMGLALLDRRVDLSTMIPVVFARVLLIVGLAGVVALSMLIPGTAFELFTRGVPALLAVAGALALNRSGVVVSNRYVLALGNASYSIYLVHPFVTQAVQKAGRAIGLSPLLALALIPVTFVLVCVVGTITHHLIERPLTVRAKALSARLVPPPRRKVAVHG